MRRYTNAHQLVMEEGDHNRPSPCRCCAEADERLHGEAAVSQRSQCARVKSPAHAELHDRCRQDQDPVDSLHRDQEPRLKHDRHCDEAEYGRSDPVAQECALLALTCRNACELHRLTCRFAFAFVVSPRKVERRSGNFVAGVCNDARKIGGASDIWEIADRGALGGKVDAHLTDAVRLAQETVDPIDARGAGHPGDGEGDLSRLHRRGNCWCARVLHTPGEYRASRGARLSAWQDPCSIRWLRCAGAVPGGRSPCWFVTAAFAPLHSIPARRFQSFFYLTTRAHQDLFVASAILRN